MRICVANAKGGVGKTTTAVYLAAVVARLNGSAVLVDADPQGSAAEWLEITPIPGVTVVEAPSERIVTQVPDRYPGLPMVVDTPPGHERIIRAALAGSDRVVLPTRVGGVEITRVAATLEMIPTGRLAGLVMIAAEERTVSYREQMAAWAEAGVDVWGTIPKRVAIASGPDGPLNPSALGAYRAVLAAGTRVKAA